MKQIVAVVVIAGFSALVGCGGKDADGDSTNPKAGQGSVADSIGAATMKDDGTIVLQLRAEGPGGLLGDALVVYKPDDPEYQEILEHLGGLKPGEEKPVPPWPEE